MQRDASRERRGTGHGLEPLRMIEKPLAFRSAIIAR